MIVLVMIYMECMIVLANNISIHTEKEMGDMIDICPTICDLMEIPVPNQCQGKSLL